MLDKTAILEGLKNNSPHKLIQRRFCYRSYFKKQYEIVNKKESKEFEIYTVAFNNDKVIDYQIKFMKKNFKDEHQHIIVDNSSDEEVSKKIRKICMDNDTMYIKLPKNILFSSQSHALALNYIWRIIIPERVAVKYFGFLDHDIFPIKKTTILPYLKKQKMYGYLLDNEKLEYARNAWTIRPGFCFFDKSLSEKFDFRPAKSLVPLYALDTGGRNYKLIFKNYNKKEMEFASKELNGVHKDLSEESLNYNDFVNYSGADNYFKREKLVYTYERLKNHERIHRSATYFLGDGNMEYKQYQYLLDLFYDKLDILYNKTHE